MSKLINFTETTFRDGQQSLIAARLRLDEILPVAEVMDKIGFKSMEVWGGATFDVCLRYLDEDPWERLRKIKKALPNTPTQMLLRGRNLLGYKPYPIEVVKMFIEKSAQNGMDIFRIFDALNDVGNMKESIEIAKGTGKHVQGAILYTKSPVHDIDHYTKTCRSLLELEVDSIALKDPSGIMHPSDASRILSELVKMAGKTPVQFHAHCTSYMAAMCYQKAIDVGVSTVDCAIAPFAGGPSQPPLEAIIESLRGTEYTYNLDMDAVREANHMLTKLKRKREISVDRYQMDASVLEHQIPGGMISNLVYQLDSMGLKDKFDEVMEEVPRVRKDLGYPVLATPTSQIVGSQAVLNIINNERYKVLFKEVKNYLLGLYGTPEGKISRELLDRIDTFESKDIEIKDIDIKAKKKEIGNLYEYEEDILSYILYPEQSLKYFKYRNTEKYKVDLDLVEEGIGYPL